MAKKSTKKEVNNTVSEEIEEIREEMQSNIEEQIEQIKEVTLDSFEELYKKEFGCNLYLKSIIKRKIGQGDKDVVTALKILRAIDRWRGTNDIPVWAEGMLKTITDIIKEDK